MAFGKFNKKKLWKKGEKFFRVNGQVPHVDSLTSGYSWLKRAGWLDRFDIKLKAICESFYHVERENHPQKRNDERLIHISKNVFYSNKSRKTKQAVYSALIKGGYISPDTTSAIFMGIFDETKFTRPVLWKKEPDIAHVLRVFDFQNGQPF